MILKIISAVEIVFEGEIASVTLPGTMGAFTVLKNHASLISTLAPGKISYVPAGEAEHDAREIDSAGGVADVDNNVVSVCLY